MIPRLVALALVIGGSYQIYHSRRQWQKRQGQAKTNFYRWNQSLYWNNLLIASSLIVLAVLIWFKA
ncbi:hypothetical protein HU830_00055 [Lactobacillus sp. DCY120]|uniref:Uncharacterized protein n=1 Tax=Bombilactobacillus apium TaxID=2675299 RepID=A0A850R4V1_9LACO|nr:hypothetical protein [Bombilactobacillus apium]NVY95602.1 hypothetical protein [Bombilactobacillus apium]